MPYLMLAEGFLSGAGVYIAGVIVVLFGALFIYASRYMKVGPNEALVISGRGTFRIVRGGSTFVWPIFEKVDVLSLELMTLDVKTPEVYTSTGVPILVDGVAQIKIDGEERAVRIAAEQFLTRTLSQIEEVAHQTLEGHLRAIMGTMTVEEIYKDRERFAQRVQETAASDLANMGLKVVSFVLRDIKDNGGYLDALGKPRTAQVKRDATVAEAQATRDSDIGRAEAQRDATIKSAQASQVAQTAKFTADTAIAESQRNYEMKRAEFQASVNQQKAQADLSYDLQKYKTNQALKVEEVRVLEIEKEKMIAVQEKEAARKAKELEATVQKPADAERYRIQTLASAAKFRMENEAAGQASAAQSIGVGEAEANRARGLAAAAVVQATGMAEAAVVQAKGEAEATAMKRKAEAWRVYNEAAISQMFIEKLPEIARAV
ncbi:MAG: flotillin family protein, partial [Pedosphaera parvula]|nr:flotillin family protein [Pedosphaera parvula]